MYVTSNQSESSKKEEGKNATNRPSLRRACVPTNQSSFLPHLNALKSPFFFFCPPAVVVASEVLMLSVEAAPGVPGRC